MKNADRALSATLSERTRKLFFLAVNTGFVEAGLPDQRCRDFYIARSRFGLHCAIVGNVIIPGGFSSNSVCAEISSSSAWRKLADSITSQGAVAGIQLTTAWRGYRGMQNFLSRDAGDVLEQCKKITASMSQHDVNKIFSALSRGSELAFNAGFRHLQLHAAHGYLFSLLIDHRLSPHSDLVLKLVRGWADDLASSGCDSSLRFSLWNGDAWIEEQSQAQFVDAIVSLPVTYLDVSAGFYNVDKRMIYPTLPHLLLSRHKATISLAERNPNVQFILSGKVSSLSEALLPNNLHLGLCRDLVANPNFLRDREQGCQDCMKCHYFSRGHRHITCGLWRDGR